jgi:hypothetical protein
MAPSPPRSSNTSCEDTTYAMKKWIAAMQIEEKKKTKKQLNMLTAQKFGELKIFAQEK